MKLKLALLSLPLILAGQATAADFYITGATAFRTAAIKAICSAFSPTGFVAGYYDPNGPSLTGAGKSVFRGTFGNIPGTTTIYCTWSGSVEGIEALALNKNVDFLTAVPTVAANLDGTGGGVLDSAVAGHTAQLAFSDVFKSSTPFGSATLFPNNSNVGVVVFAWVANKGADAGLTNVTSQSARAIFTQGFQPLSLFTGLTADQGKNVFLTGRNDASGTRTNFLAESGFAISRTLNQYKGNSDGSTVTRLQVWPTGDTGNISSIWNPDTAGNGGYGSGSGLTNVMKSTSASVTVYEADNTTVAFPAAAVSIVGYQSTKDAKDSLDGGGRVLSYNGFPVTYTGSAISSATRTAVINGQYTMWGYEHLYSRTAINFTTPANDLDRLYKTIRDGCNATNLSTSGIPLSEMNVVSRSTDGGLVAP